MKRKLIAWAMGHTVHEPVTWSEGGLRRGVGVRVSAKRQQIAWIGLRTTT